MSNYFSTKINVPFREINQEIKEAEVFIHSLNYGDRSQSAEIGDSSYYDCNEFRNAWYSKLKRDVKGYFNSTSYTGVYGDKSIKELMYIAFLRGREIAKKIFSQWFSNDETFVIILPPNSLREGANRSDVRNNASCHIGSWIGFGVQAFLEMEGQKVVSIRHEEFISISQKNIENIIGPFRVIILDDTILKGDTVYLLIISAIRFLITMNSKNHRIDVCSFFARSDGIKTLEEKNEFVQGFSPQKISEKPIVNMRVNDEMYAEILDCQTDSADWTDNEQELMIIQGY
jgi:hypothetical protein